MDSEIDAFVKQHDKLRAWRQDTVPIEWTMRDLNSRWCRGDDEENYLRRGNKDYSPTDVTYVTNRAGFRTHLPIIDQLASTTACFGDSFTFGVGIPTIDTWVARLNGDNFGLPGYSADGISRLVYQLVPMMPSVRAVLVVMPGMDRREAYTSREPEHSPKQFNPHSPSGYRPSNLTDDEFTSRSRMVNFYDSFANFMRSLALIRQVCDERARFFWTTWEPRIYRLPPEILECYFDPAEFVNVDSEWYLDYTPRSRDGLHPGVAYHKALATAFQEKLCA